MLQVPLTRFQLRALRCYPLSATIKRVLSWKMSDFNYDLPIEKIAKTPIYPRDASKLLVCFPSADCASSKHIDTTRVSLRRDVGLKAATHDFLDVEFNKLPGFLPKDSHLIFNESRVFAARLFLTSDKDDAPVEAMLLDPEEPSKDPSEALNSPLDCQVWRVMLRSSRYGLGEKMKLYNDGTKREFPSLQFEIVKVHSEWIEDDEEDGLEVSLRFFCSEGSEECSAPAKVFFSQCGSVPIPPYLNRDATKDDLSNYQVAC